MKREVLNVFVVAWLIVIYFVRTVGSCENFDFDKGIFVDDDTTDSHETDIKVERNETFHSDVVWKGRLLRLDYNYTEMLVKWDQPNETAAGSKLCAFKLHYYYGTNISRVPSSIHHSAIIASNETQFLIGGLEMGRSYHAYLEAVFDQNIRGQTTNVLQSWVLIAITKGVGRDNPCNCHVLNTVNHNVSNCDIYSGQCRCKHRLATAGLRCEWCRVNHYLHPEEGCTACDNCPKDQLISNGSCHYFSRDKSMQCECNVGYKGQSCEQCDFGFYRAGNYCVPCNCSGNENILVEDFCDAGTGHCTSCAFHTFGHRCDVCYPGYSGDALARSCSPQSTLGHDIGIAVLSIIIIILVVVVGVLLFRRCARHRRRLRFFSSIKGALDSNSAINFSTMMEEPEMEFHPHDRQLQIIGTQPTSS